MFYIIKKGIRIDDIIITKDKDIFNENCIGNHVIECFNEEDLLLKLLSIFSKDSYFKIVEVIRKFNVEVSNDYLIKSYCSKCNRLKYYQGDDIYLLLGNQQDTNRLEVLSICTKYEYITHKDNLNGYLLRIKKESLPFYLSLLLKRFTAKDFYFCFKNLTGIRNIPTISSQNSQFYIVKNKSKIVSYHISYDLALKCVKLIEETLPDNNSLKLKIHEVDGYEALLDSIDNFKIQKSSDFEKYMIDYDWYLDYCTSKKYIDISNLDLKDNVFLIRNKNGETIIKNNQNDMYSYIKENKLYAEDVFFFKNVDADYNSVIKYFDLIRTELSVDYTLSEYLKDVTYVDKVKILNTLVEISKDTENNNDVSYSLSKSDVYGYDLSFFKEEFSFHKHITSLDYGVDSLTYGQISIKILRSIFKPENKPKTNNKLSRTDIAFNVSSLFNKNNNVELLKSLKEMDMTIDVDAYLKNNKSACGVVVRDNNNEILIKISRKLDAKTSVEAEIKGAIFALNYITRLEPNAKNICLRYDCFSVADYLISEPTSNIGVKYQKFVKDITRKYPDLNIYIKKVRGHSSDFFNDIADSLAGNFFN